ncbi:MAG: response regulator [Bacteroidota bacterium]
MTKVKHILLVEDNEGDVVLTMEALKEAPVANKVTVARDGLEALNMLRKNTPYENFVYPDVILMDINLPKMNGKEVLSIIKSDSLLKTIPVIMLSTSSSESDISESYKNHANCYVTKPASYEHFSELVKLIDNFWTKVVKTPGETITI